MTNYRIDLWVEGSIVVVDDEGVEIEDEERIDVTDCTTKVAEIPYPVTRTDLRRTLNLPAGWGAEFIQDELDGMCDVLNYHVEMHFPEVRKETA